MRFLAVTGTTSAVKLPSAEAALARVNEVMAWNKNTIFDESGQLLNGTYKLWECAESTDLVDTYLATDHTVMSKRG